MDRRVLFINEHPLRVAVRHTAWVNVNVDEGTEKSGAHKETVVPLLHIMMRRPEMHLV